MNANVVFQKDVCLQDLGGGMSRAVLAHDEKMMVVEVHFEKGAVGKVHSHPHTQCTYVKEGVFTFTVDGEEVCVRPGDTLNFPSGVPHGTTCLEKGVLLDIFTPMREDFLK